MIYHMYTKGSGECTIFTVEQGDRLIPRSIVTPRTFKRKAYMLMHE